VRSASLDANWNVATGASAIGTLAFIYFRIEDFRPDITRNTVPTLLLHVTPIAFLFWGRQRFHPEDSEDDQESEIRGAQGRTPGVLWTHSDEVNTELVSFIVARVCRTSNCRRQ